ncbi:uncharacterized protein A4U43_C03F23180 [Asparagus officinalis]|uniref:Uncharacterized protein n=1 Tax=Asparagus officinalis TaxID=4686 RepID=A0A5P1FCC4_ASPOF|nr:uncharacterized protein A4U43_C03F23180 [Asparagus officinalis]
MPFPPCGPCHKPNPSEAEAVATCCGRVSLEVYSLVALLSVSFFLEVEGYVTLLLGVAFLGVHFSLALAVAFLGVDLLELVVVGLAEGRATTRWRGLRAVVGARLGEATERWQLGLKEAVLGRISELRRDEEEHREGVGVEDETWAARGAMVALVKETGRR